MDGRGRVAESASLTEALRLVKLRGLLCIKYCTVGEFRCLQSTASRPEVMLQHPASLPFLGALELLKLSLLTASQGWLRAREAVGWCSGVCKGHPALG